MTTDFYQQLSANFCLGPQGLGPVVAYMSQLYDAILSAFDRRAMPADHVKICVEKINLIAQPLESLLISFRSSIFRGMYDPKGFSDLQDAMKQHSNFFAVCRLLLSIYSVTLD